MTTWAELSSESNSRCHRGCLQIGHTKSLFVRGKRCWNQAVLDPPFRKEEPLNAPFTIHVYCPRRVHATLSRDWSIKHGYRCLSPHLAIVFTPPWHCPIDRVFHIQQVRRSSFYNLGIISCAIIFTIDMRAVPALLVPLLALVPFVAAHGYVGILGVDGTSYNGQEPTEDGQPNDASVIRRISTIDPVKGASNPSLNCGQNATAASLVAPTKPGSALTFQWAAGGGEGVSPGFICRPLLTH